MAAVDLETGGCSLAHGSWMNRRRRFSLPARECEISNPEEPMIQRLTTAQALVKFLESQYVCRDGKQQQFFAGCFGIFGHGNVAGIGQALEQISSFSYYLARNEQAMV